MPVFKDDKFMPEAYDVCRFAVKCRCIPVRDHAKPKIRRSHPRMQYRQGTVNNAELDQGITLGAVRQSASQACILVPS